MVMSSKQVIKKFNSYNSKISYWYDKITELQETCPHHNLTYEYKGTSDGWDYNGRYWVEWKCPDCEKNWETDQSYVLEQRIKRKYPNATEIKKNY